ncbi:hypothetical protein HYALB_00012491 [Hymenoscyphus albidus]|uniref:2EXR domain-containing protein n=1 Tax=Hymenoscyphus albidus TaxID=595503 RepID=A0A9N9LTI9_9HELO|nr:hypothetical protein HYALB_00012491 [Hymenoscyphus albidus]
METAMEQQVSSETTLTSAEHVPTPKFTCFQELPWELRMAIWEHLLPPPRHIKIRCEKASHPINKRRFAKSFESNQPLPTLLQICHETRDFILTTYHPYIQTEHSPSYTYTSFEKDTISLDDGVLSHLKRKDLDVIEKLELAVQDAAYFTHYNLEILKRMKSLRELTLQDEMEERIIAAWDSRSWHFKVADEFRQAMAVDPGWECPRIRIMKGEEEIVMIEGGAAIPGWVPEVSDDPSVTAW